PTRPPGGAGKKLAGAAEALAPGPPRPSGRGVGGGRVPAGAQADRPPRLVPPGAAAAVRRPDPLRLAVRVRLRPAEDGRDGRRAAARGERGPEGRRPGVAGRPRRPGGSEGAGGAGGQRRLARREAVGGAGERGAALPAAVHARVAAGRAAVAAPP